MSSAAVEEPTAEPVAEPAVEEAAPAEPAAPVDATREIMEEPARLSEASTTEATSNTEQHDEAAADADTGLALEALEKVINDAKLAQHDLKETLDAGLAPARSLRLRRKSKDLEKAFAEMASGTLERVFHKIDIDGSGTLEPHELKQAFDEFGRPCSDDAIKAAFKALDTNNDGVISLEEFKSIAFKISTSTA